MESKAEADLNTPFVVVHQVTELADVCEVTPGDESRSPVSCEERLLQQKKWKDETRLPAVVWTDKDC
jgi:hypothetical protein